MGNAGGRAFDWAREQFTSHLLLSVESKRRGAENVEEIYDSHYLWFWNMVFPEWDEFDPRLDGPQARDPYPWQPPFIDRWRLFWFFLTSPSHLAKVDYAKVFEKSEHTVNRLPNPYNMDNFKNHKLKNDVFSEMAHNRAHNRGPRVAVETDSVVPVTLSDVLRREKTKEVEYELEREAYQRTPIFEWHEEDDWHTEEAVDRSVRFSAEALYERALRNRTYEMLLDTYAELDNSYWREVAAREEYQKKQFIMFAKLEEEEKVRDRYRIKKRYGHFDEEFEEPLLANAPSVLKRRQARLMDRDRAAAAGVLPQRQKENPMRRLRQRYLRKQTQATQEQQSEEEPEAGADAKAPEAEEAPAAARKGK